MLYGCEWKKLTMESAESKKALFNQICISLLTMNDPIVVWFLVAGAVLTAVVFHFMHETFSRNHHRQAVRRHVMVENNSNRLRQRR